VPLKPPIPGIDRPGHFTVRHIPDVQIRNSAYNIQFDIDLVFEKALVYLSEEYGIE